MGSEYCINDSMRRDAWLPEQTMHPLGTVFGVSLAQSVPDHGTKRPWVGSIPDLNVRKRPRLDAGAESSLLNTDISDFNKGASIPKVPFSILLDPHAMTQHETNNLTSMTDSREMLSCGIGSIKKHFEDWFASFALRNSIPVSGNKYHHINEKLSYPPGTLSEHPGPVQYNTQSTPIFDSTVSKHVTPYAPINPLDEFIFEESNFEFTCNEGLRSPDGLLAASYECVQPDFHLPVMTYPTNNNTEDEIYTSPPYKDPGFRIPNYSLTSPAQNEFANPMYVSDELGQKSTHSKYTNQLNIKVLGPTRRRPFKNKHDRQQTAETRRNVGCMRCRMQRIRCDSDPSNPTGICLTCKRAKPKIYHLPCLRYKLTEVRLFREGHFAAGHEWSHRWSSNIMVNITNWASSEVKTIDVTQDYSQTKIEFQVREFVPIKGDMLHRQWADGDTKKSVAIPNYAIVDMTAALNAHNEHIVKDGHKYFESAIKNNDRLLWDTHSMAFMYSNSALTQEQRELLQAILKLWVTVRLCVRSQRICGTEVLGMSPDIMDRSSPMSGNIPVPPVLAAQAQFIVTQKLQAPLRDKILDLLQKLTLAQKPTNWFCIYLSTFILLHNCSLLTKHDIEYARKHGLKTKHARPDMINDLHIGANILLAHFHYACKGFSPFSLRWNPEETTSMAKLDDKQICFIRQTAIHVNLNESSFKKLLDQRSYEDEHYFIAQLYEENWKPRSTV